MSEFEKQHDFWKKLDEPRFWEKITPPKYVYNPCNTLSHCDIVGEVIIRNRVIKILWDYVLKCILIQDDNNWYHLRYTTIDHLTVRQVIAGIVSDKYMETIWSTNGEDVLDIIAHHAPLFKVLVLDVDDVDTCEKL